MISVNDEVKRRTISAFILFHLVVIASLSIPSDAPFARAIGKQVARYAQRTGLFQSWDMFAPNPKNDNIYVDAEITFRDGQKRVWTFPQMNELGYTERYFKERYRKFANERLHLATNAVLLPDAARYIARLNANASNPPQSVKLVYHWSVIPPPPLPGEIPQMAQWGHRELYTYAVKPGDLR
jgi:hypothetical protein